MKRTTFRIDNIHLIGNIYQIRYIFIYSKFFIYFFVNEHENDQKN